MSQPDFLHLLSIAPGYFFSFLTVKGIVALDSACVNKAVRKRLLDSLQGISFVHLPCYRPMLEWYVRRKVHPSVIVVDKWWQVEDAVLVSEVTESVTDILIDLPILPIANLEQQFALAVLIRFCPRLEQINWLWPSGIGFDAFEYLRMSTCSPCLVKLSIHTSDFKLDDFRTILCNSKNLRIIDIFNSRALISGHALESVVELCPQLTSLQFDHSNTVSDGVFYQLATQLPSLSSLRITEALIFIGSNAFVTPVGFSEFAHNCRPLSALHLCGVRIAVDDVLSAATRSAHLQELGLSYCTSTEVANHWFQQLMMLVPDLHDIYLEGSTFVALDDIQFMLSHCTKLRNIDLNYVQGVDADTMTSIAMHCTDLRTLELRNVQGGNVDAAFDSLAHNCLNLRKLSLVYCDITQHTLYELATHCTWLNRLSLTTHDVVDFSEAAPFLKQLRVLNVFSLESMSDDSLLSIVTHCRHLQYVSIRQYSGKCRDVRIVHTIHTNCHMLHFFQLHIRCSQKVYEALVELQRARDLCKMNFVFDAQLAFKSGRWCAW